MGQTFIAKHIGFDTVPMCRIAYITSSNEVDVLRNIMT